MRWFKLQTYIGIEDDRDEDEMAAEINKVLMGNLAAQPYYLSNTALIPSEAPEQDLSAPWLWSGTE